MNEVVGLKPVLGAELRKLTTRRSARVALTLFVLGAVVVPFAMRITQQGLVRTLQERQAAEAGAPVHEVVTRDATAPLGPGNAAGLSPEAEAAPRGPMPARSIGPDIDPAEIQAQLDTWFHAARAAEGALWARNFFVARAFLIWIVAEMFAGELVARTLREDLMRPVQRRTVFVAKLLAAQALVAGLVVVPGVVSFAVGAALFGVQDGLGDAARGYALAWVGDAGFVCMVAAIALWLRSVPGTVLGVFLYWVLDQALGWLLWGVEAARGWLAGMLQTRGMEEAIAVLDRIVALRPWLPSSAFNLAWDSAAESPIAGASVASLVVLSAIFALAGARTFSRMDVD
jgi:hypothetical protein